MAPRGRKKKAGLMREDAARDAMRAFGFEARVINVSIKELLEVYGEEGWFLIEEYSYQVLLNTCLEQAQKLEEEMAEEQNQEIAEEEHEQTAQEEEHFACSDEESDGDDDEMIQLTPEPLCEELEELLSELRGEKKRKRPTRWGN